MATWVRAASAISRHHAMGGRRIQLQLVPFESCRIRRFHVREKAQAVPLTKLTDSFLDGTSSVYLEELQRCWESDPKSVDDSWDIFFTNFLSHKKPSAIPSTRTIHESMSLMLLIRAYQVSRGFNLVLFLQTKPQYGRFVVWIEMICSRDIGFNPF